MLFQYSIHLSNVPQYTYIVLAAQVIVLVYYQTLIHTIFSVLNEYLTSVTKIL